MDILACSAVSYFSRATRASGTRTHRKGRSWPLRNFFLHGGQGFWNSLIWDTGKVKNIPILAAAINDRDCSENTM